MVGRSGETSGPVGPRFTVATYGKNLVMDKDKVCALCGLSEFSEHDYDFGSFMCWSEREDFPLKLHTGCLYWSHHVNIDDQTTAEDYIYCNPDEIEQIVISSGQIKCVICSTFGASIIPYSTEMQGRPIIPPMVHFPCAVQDGFIMQQGDPSSYDTIDNRRYAIPPPNWKALGTGKIPFYCRNPSAT